MDFPGPHLHQLRSVDGTDSSPAWATQDRPVGAGAPTAYPGTELPLVGFDIETDTSRGGLDPRTSSVVAAALSSDSGDEVLAGAEADLLESLDERIAELGPALLVTWNGAAFDLPFIAHRAAVLGLVTGLSTVDAPVRRGMHPNDPNRVEVRARWHQMIHLDGYRLYRGDVGRTLGISCGLKALARLVGIEPVELDRTSLHLCDDREVADYVASDARVAVALVRRRMPAALTMADWPLRPPSEPGAGSGHPVARD